MVVGLIFIVIIFNPYGLCLLKGNKVFCDHTTGGNVPSTWKTNLLHEESVTWKIMTSSVKAKIWKLVGKLVSAVVAVAKNSILVFNSNSMDFNSNSIFNPTNSNSNSGIGIELQFQFRNWIDPNPDCASCKHIFKGAFTLGAISRPDWRWKWVTKKLTGSLTPRSISQGVIMTHRPKWLLHPFHRAAQRHRPKSYRAGHWYRQWNSQQQLLYHGDIAPYVNSATIFDAPTPCCGVT